MDSKVLKNDFTKLNKFVKGLSQNHVVKIGIMGDSSGREATGAAKPHTARWNSKTLQTVYSGGGHSVIPGSTAGSTNAELGAVHELGSPSRGIPARSFLRMPLLTKSREIIAQASAGMQQLLADGQMVMVLKRLGIACENAVQQAFSSEGFGFWPRLSRTTIDRKKSSRILIDTGQLRRAITSKVETVG